MLYLASPYSHPEERVRTRRYLATREFVYAQLQLGYPLVSPIVYCHQFARDFGAPLDAKSWRYLNESLLIRSEAVWVLTLQGWDSSVGVKAELEAAELLGLPVTHCEPILHANF